MHHLILKDTLLELPILDIVRLQEKEPMGIMT
jgi:hypothetical protein